MLAVGYLIGIFGRNDGHELVVAGFAVVMAVAVIVLTNVACKKLAQKRYNADAKIPYKNVESFVDTVVTDAEIDEICEEAFDNKNNDGKRSRQ